MIAIASDHGGFDLKEEIKSYLTAKGYEVKDYGTHDKSSCDYPDIAKALCDGINSGQCERGILLCGTGIGISMAANKIQGIRAACCSDYFSAKYTRLHNDANVLCMGGRVVGAGLGCELAEIFLTTDFEGGRHGTRVEKLMALEK